MSATAEYIERLEALKEGERSRLRRLAGMPLDETLAGFDLFTGLWWPLRDRSRAAPRRETSWLVAKLYGMSPIPHLPSDPARQTELAAILGRCEPKDERGRARYRGKFDALLCSSLSGIEPHLRWALSVAASAVRTAKPQGLDWVRLLDDLSIWDRGEEHSRKLDIRDIWAELYLRNSL
ncbi:MAG: type I-E CRISPR-associated protein Cse2/CasB [Acidobacteriota bacterium]